MTSDLSRKISSVGIENRRDPEMSPVGEHAPLPISVVIISYNSREYLRACLTSIEVDQCSEVIVVDNFSTDGSDEIVIQEFPQIRLIKSKQNNGYGAAANLAITHCSSKYVLLLNCDTLLQPETLQTLSDYLNQHPQAAIVGPALVNPDGTRQDSCFAFPTPLQILLRDTSLPTLMRFFSKTGTDDLLDGSPRYARAVPWVLGAALAIRRSAFESVDGFDRSFFMYYEEVDLCYRLHMLGWQVHFTPAATVTHIGGVSTHQQRSAMAIQLYKSLCHFYQQHYSRTQRVQLKLVLTYLMLRNILKDAFNLFGRTFRRSANNKSSDWMVWRSVLSGVWSTNGWLKP